MWHSFAQLVYKFRNPLFIVLLGITVFLGYHASKVKLGYEYTKSIPTNNPKYIEYQNFKKTFGEDGNLLVAGFTTDKLFTLPVYNAYSKLHASLMAIPGVLDVLSVPSAVNLVMNYDSARFESPKIFPATATSQAQLDSGKALLGTLPVYKNLLYNPDNNSYICGIRLNGDSINSKSRESLVAKVVVAIDSFAATTKLEVHKSGLPLIRSALAVRLQKEMGLFLVGSIVISAIILLLFFRSISSMLLSLVTVGIGVVWSLGTMHLFGYNITLLNALIPPLVVVVGIPNCIYFLNKYHTAWLDTGNKNDAIIQMIAKMGVVTLFCNITAAIGFAVFARTESAILKEFGVVAGINIFMLFVISLIIIPFALHILKAPNPSQLKYLNNKAITRFLGKMEGWVVNHPKFTLAGTALVLIISSIGLFKLKSQGFIVDDLPKNDKIYTDLKYFEKNFKGIMPLEIVIDSRRPKGIRQLYGKLDKIDSLEMALQQFSFMNRPISFVDGLKFAKQAMSGGDSSAYFIPNQQDLVELKPYLTGKKEAADENGVATENTDENNMPSNAQQSGAGLSKLLNSFIDSAKQKVRISVSMADVGTLKLNSVLDSVRTLTAQYIDTSKFDVSLTGSTVTFLEGSSFIIKGLKQSIIEAFVLIAVCMLLLFKSFRILLCSLIPNVVPLVITAGVMGWMGVPLKPSTVLVFSVVLGIAIDITIRFLVNYKQILPQYKNDTMGAVTATMQQTGLSIVYTSLVLIAGFVIFMFSSFGGTQALGGLTTLTLLVATLTNIILLPVLLLVGKRKQSAINNDKS
jgi:uncharacterized protein